MPAASPSRPLSLARHVRACESNGQVVLLDLSSNRYLAVGRIAAQALADYVQGWPVCPQQSTRSPLAPEVDALARRLAAQRLLAPSSPAPHTHIELAEAGASLDFSEVGEEASASAGHVVRFMASTARTAWWLRYRSLQAIAAAVAARRKPHRAPDTDVLEAMKARAATFERLRPLVFTSREKCLFDSLALMTFLASEGLFPRWVIGVKTGPFGAHSWVQFGAAVLNDQHAFVRRFRPILVV